MEIYDDGRTVFSQVASFRRLVIRLIRAKPYGDPFHDYMDFFGRYKDKIIDLMVFEDIHALVDLDNSFKCIFFLLAKMEKYDSEGNLTKSADVWFQSQVHLYNLYSSPEERSVHFNESIAAISRQIERYVHESSGWIFERVLHFDLTLANYSYFGRGGNSLLPPELPSTINKKYSIIKFTGTPELNCFQEAVTVAAFLHHRRDHTKRKPSISVIYSDWEKEWKKDTTFTIPSFPDTISNPDKIVDIDEIYLFENENPDYFITVVGYENGDFFPIHRFKHERYATRRDTAKLITLFLFDGHYFAVKSLVSLVCRQVNSYNKRFVCPFCFQFLSIKTLLDLHMEQCAFYPAQVIKMPEEEKILQFFQYSAIQNQPFVFYADSESYLEPITKQAGATTYINTHKPLAVAYYLAIHPEFVDVLQTKLNQDDVRIIFPEYPNDLYQAFVGENCFTDFMASLCDLTTRLYKLLKFWKLKAVPPGYEHIRETTTICHICNRPLIDDDDKVIDHDHWTGKFRGIAHQNCNIQVKMRKNLFPVIFHNFKSYDCHLLCKEAKFSDLPKSKIFCIPSTSEKYLSMSFKWQVGSFEVPTSTNPITISNELRFLDSLQFLSSGLARLMDQHLSDNGEAGFIHMRHNMEHNFKFALRKGVFPYTYIDSMNRLKEKQLPPKEAFKNDLTDGSEISTSEYSFAQEVWKKRVVEPSVIICIST